jgi:hypothetical protein
MFVVECQERERLILELHAGIKNSLIPPQHLIESPCSKDDVTELARTSHRHRPRVPLANVCLWSS